MPRESLALIIVGIVWIWLNNYFGNPLWIQAMGLILIAGGIYRVYHLLRH